MIKAPASIYSLVNPFLLLLAIFNIALTVYCSTQFYAYLPTSDVWVHVDFLVQAAQGKLSLPELFDKHNGVHVLALPKLVYFLDMYWGQGSGRITVWAAWCCLAASFLIFFRVIREEANLDNTEKTFLVLFASLFIFSASQMESLLNPANVQWAMMVLFFTLTAFFYSRPQNALMAWSAGRIAGMTAGILGLALCSASPLLALIPLGLFALAQNYSAPRTIRFFIMAIVIAVLCILLVDAIQFHPNDGRLPLGLTVLATLNGWDHGALNVEPPAFDSLYKIYHLYVLLVLNSLVFLADFLLPFIERLNQPLLTLLGVITLCGLAKLNFSSTSCATAQTRKFLQAMIAFTLFSGLVIGLVRSHTAHAFTYRFVNLGIVFCLCVLILSWTHLKNRVVYQRWAMGLMLICSILLTAINVQEASAFGYGRNHIRLNQVAQSLGLRHSNALVSVPGSAWQETEYQFIRDHIHKLKAAHTGIFRHPVLEHLGNPVHEFLSGKNNSAPCTFNIQKVRLLEQNPDEYKIIGQTLSKNNQQVLDHVLLADSNDVIRGYGIPVMPARNLFRSLKEGKHWAGFMQLENTSPPPSTTNKGKLYAYGDKRFCGPYPFDLPTTH